MTGPTPDSNSRAEHLPSVSPIPNSKFRIPHSAARRRASSLITTLLVLVVLSTIVVAFMQSMSIERSVARSALNRERAVAAAESGLSAAIAVMARAATTNFVVVQNRASGAPETWPLAFISLDGTGAPISTNQISTFLPSLGNLTFSLASNVVRQAPLHPVLDQSNRTNGAFAFTVIDSGSKQNLLRYPAITPRGFGTTLREVPLVLPDLGSLSSAQSNAINAAALTPQFTNQFLSTSTFNQFFSASSTINASQTWADTESWAAAIAPSGRPKINLRSLKVYVDTRAATQTAGNPRSLLVDQLLGFAAAPVPSPWGGGDLTWLVSASNPNRYAQTEARQIVANLIDYLDADLHPTTDNIDSPTYFGVEARFTSNGTLRGHPYVTAIGFGLIINSSTSPSFRGQLNSTRVLAYLSLVNPWSERISQFQNAYSFEIEDIRVNGNATGGNLGDQASSYFPQRFDPLSDSSRLSEGPTTLGPFSGAIFPYEPNRNNFRADRDFQPLNRQPAGMRFSNLSFQIVRLRIRFTSDDNTTSVVQVLDGLSSFTIPMSPSSYTVPSGGEVRLFSPGSVRNALFLNDDPRSSYAASSWQASQLTAAEAAATQPPGGTSGVNVFRSMNATQGDGIQGVATNHLWYSSQSITNHLFVRSPAIITNNLTLPYDPAQTPPPAALAVESIGEIGYIWSGRPWQTLRIADTPAGAGTRDYLLMDYIDSGTMRFKTNSANITYRDGQINPSTALRPTLLGVFRGVSGLSDAQATTIVNSYLSNPSGYPFINPSGIGADTNLLTPGATTKFARESVMRRVANLLTSRSQDFTVVVAGQARDVRTPSRVQSSVRLTARVRMVDDPSNPANPPTPVVISKTIQ